MSTFIRRTKNPRTGEFEDAEWLDDYYGKHQYAVRFPSGGIYREDDGVIQWEFYDQPQDTKGSDETTEAERDKREYERDMLKLFIQREEQEEHYVFKGVV